MNSTSSVQRWHIILVPTSCSDFSYLLKLWSRGRQTVQHISWSQGCSTSLHISKSSSQTFIPSVNCAWQYYQTPKSAVTSKQFYLLNPLLQFCLQNNNYLLYFKSPKWLFLTIIPQLQLWSHHLGHPSILSHVLMTIWLIHQILYDAQDKFTKETTYLWGLSLVLISLARQLHLSLACQNNLSLNLCIMPFINYMIAISKEDLVRSYKERGKVHCY